MNKSEKYYQELMTHRHVSRRGLFRAFVSAAKHTMPEVITTRLGHSLPPGAVPDAELIAQCTRCSQCIDVCSMGVLSRHEDGYPQLMIEYASCDGCGLCIAACSSDALRVQSRFDTGLRPMFSNTACVNPVRQCKQCVDVCPRQACFIDESGLVSADNECCDGCGECAIQCPHNAVTLY